MEKLYLLFSIVLILSFSIVSAELEVGSKESLGSGGVIIQLTNLCPVNQVVSGFDPQGDIICVADQIGPGGETDTNASTECSGDEVLLGNTTCKSIATIGGTGGIDIATILANFLRINASNANQQLNFQQQNLADIQNITLNGTLCLDDSCNHALLSNINPVTRFNGIAEDALWFRIEGSRPEGHIGFINSFNNLTLSWSQVGKNNSFSGSGNSLGIIPNYWGFENFTSADNTINMTALSNYITICDTFGGEFFAPEDVCRFNADTRGRGMPLLFTGDLEVWRQIVTHQGITSLGDAEYFMQGFNFDIVNGSLHQRTSRIELVGFGPGVNVTRLNANFNEGVLAPFILTTSGGGASEWTVESDVSCHQDDCARAQAGAGSPLRIMKADFSTEDLDATHLSFWITTLNINAGDLLNVTMNNNVDSGSVDLFSTSSVISDEQQNISLPSSMDDQTNITIFFRFNANNPINEEVFVDEIIVLGNSTTDTTANVTRLDTIILLGDGSQEIRWNDTSKVLQLPGDVSFINVTETNLNITGSIILNNQQITDWDNVSLFDQNVLLRNGSRTLTGPWDAGNNITSPFFIGSGAFLHSVNETDTLQSVTNRNGTTSNNISVYGFSTGDILAGEIDARFGLDNGAISIGDAELFMSNMFIGAGLNLNGTLVIRNTDGDSSIKFAWAGANNKIRLAIPMEGTPYALYNPRSEMIGGKLGQAFDDGIINCTAQGYNSIDCSTDVSGADLGLQDDFELHGSIFGGNTTTGDRRTWNITDDGNFTTEGSITADTYFGDGSQLTGINTGNPFDQSVNTTDNVTFHNVSLSGNLSVGFITSPAPAINFNKPIRFTDIVGAIRCKNDGLCSLGVSNVRFSDVFSFNFTASNRINVDDIFSLDEKAFFNYSEFAKGYLVLDGNGDYLNASVPAINLTGGTLSAWVRFPTGSTTDGVTRQFVSLGIPGDNTNRFELRKNAGNNELTFGYRANSNNDNPTVTGFNRENTWTHITGVYNASSVSVYLDGVLNITIAKDNDFTADTFTRIAIGENAQSGGQFWKGDVDEVMYFNHSLLASEIVLLNNSGRNNQTFTDDNLAVWYQLNIDGRDKFGVHDGELIDNAFIMKTSVGEAFNVKNLGIEQDLVIGRNLFGDGYMISEDGNAEFNKNGDFGGNITIGSTRVFLTSTSSPVSIRTTQTDVDLNLRADGVTYITLDANGNQINLESGVNVIAESGIRIGSDSAGKEIDDSSQGSISSTLFIGDEEIDTSIPSDERTKQNITSTSTNLNELQNLNIIDHNYNKSVYNKSGRFTSLLAQDIQLIYPEYIKNFTIMKKESQPIMGEVCEEFEGELTCKNEVVNMTEEITEDYLMIDYDRFIPKILKWVQDLFNWNEEQDTRTSYLESELCKKDSSYGFCPKL